MYARLLALVLLSTACASTRALQAPPAEPLERFACTATIGSVPPGASEVEIVMEVPERWASASLHIVGVHGLVGNSMFESASPAPLESGNARITWAPRDENGTHVQALVVSTAGKPLELTVVIARTAGAAVELTALEAELSRRTTVAVDDAPHADVAVRLQRVN
jgi:hypothetical protein